MLNDACAFGEVQVESDSMGTNALPFSAGMARADRARLAQPLVEAVAPAMSPARVAFVVGDGVEGLRLERRFRLRWWMDGGDPMRSALHRTKTRVYSIARSTGRWACLTAAWRSAERQIHSARWRGHWRDLTAHAAPGDVAFLRLAFRFAQQAWSRAARLQAIMPADTPSPFAPLIELLARGALPLGFAHGALWIFLWHPAAGNGGRRSEVVEMLPAVAKVRSKHVFLSALFRDAALAERWRLALRDHGWLALHGPVNEDLAPAEVQLAERIRGTCAAVGLIDLPDADFGLPWWMYQELDYASACGRPVALISRTERIESGLRGVRALGLAPTSDGDVLPGSAVWRWLEDNAPASSGG